MKKKISIILISLAVIIVVIVSVSPYLTNIGTDLLARYLVIKSMSNAYATTTDSEDEIETPTTDNYEEYIKNYIMEVLGDYAEEEEDEEFEEAYINSNTYREVSRDDVQEYLDNNSLAIASLVKDNKYSKSEYEDSRYYDIHYGELFSEYTEEQYRGVMLVDYFTHKYVDQIKCSYAAYIEYYYPGSLWEYDYEFVTGNDESYSVYATGSYQYTKEDGTSIKFIVSGSLEPSDDTMQYSFMAYEIDLLNNMDPVPVEEYIY